MSHGVQEVVEDRVIGSIVGMGILEKICRRWLLAQPRYAVEGPVQLFDSAEEKDRPCDIADGISERSGFVVVVTQTVGAVVKRGNLPTVAHAPSSLRAEVIWPSIWGRGSQ